MSVDGIAGRNFLQWKFRGQYLRDPHESTQLSTGMDVLDLVA